MSSTRCRRPIGWTTSCAKSPAAILPDVVIDATGNPQSMSAAFGLVAHGGRLVFVGLTGEEIRFRHSAFHRPEGTLLCSAMQLPADFTRIIGLIQSGRSIAALDHARSCELRGAARRDADIFDA